jgi:hypothetical protein
MFRNEQWIGGFVMNVTKLPMQTVAYILSLAAVFVMPYVAHVLAIVIGYPFTALLRKVTYVKHPFSYKEPEYSLDVYFLQLLAAFFEGLLCLGLAFILFQHVFGLDMFRNRGIIFLIAIVKMYNIYRKEDLAHARTNEFVWELFGFITFVIGVIVMSNALGVL